MRRILTLSFLCISIASSFAQLQVPTDYLSKDFHKGRREALPAAQSKEDKTERKGVF